MVIIPYMHQNVSQPSPASYFSAVSLGTAVTLLPHHNVASATLSCPFTGGALDSSFQTTSRTRSIQYWSKIYVDGTTRSGNTIRERRKIGAPSMAQSRLLAVDERPGN